MKSFLYALLFFLRALALAAPPSEEHAVFIQRENINITKYGLQKSTVSKQYMPGEGVEFQVPYVLIPVDEITVVDSGLGEEQRQHLFVRQNGQLKMRFFIHPDSFDLYKPLIEKYGIAGAYTASPTASTRTLLIWDEKRPELPALFAKLSLDKAQYNLGRVVSDWEVRRSVLISKMLAGAEEKTLLENGVYIIPEFAGAYVDAKWAMGSHIDTNQFTVFRHGQIFRDASFIKKFHHLDIFPAFTPFAEREGGKEPLIVEWWKESGEPSFEKFLRDFLVDPFIKSTANMVFKHGLIPDAHAQNFLIGRNRKTGKIETFFHRDVGSMKVSFKLRLANGLPIKELQTHNSLYDFKHKWSETIMEKPFAYWFFQHVLGPVTGHEEVLQKYVPEYKSLEQFQYVNNAMVAELSKLLPVKEAGARDGMMPKEAVRSTVNRFIEENPPEKEKLDQLIHRDGRTQPERGQALSVPESWKIDGGILKLPPNPAWAKETTPLHYEEILDASKIFMLDTKDYVAQANAKKARVYGFNGDYDLFPAVKFGSAADPRYFLVAGFDRALGLGLAGERIRVEVLEDVTLYDRETQVDIIEKFGARWAQKLQEFPPAPMEKCEAKASSTPPLPKGMHRKLRKLIRRSGGGRAMLKINQLPLEHLARH